MPSRFRKRRPDVEMVASANPKDSADYSTFTSAPPPDPCAHQEFSAPAHAHNVAHLDSAISIVLAAVSLPAPFPSNPHRFDASPPRISISTLRHSGLSRMNYLAIRDHGAHACHHSINIGWLNGSLTGIDFVSPEIIRYFLALGSGAASVSCAKRGPVRLGIPVLSPS